jgi:hypothetical protein
MPSMTRSAPLPPTEFFLQALLCGEAHVLRPWRAGGAIRWAHNLSGVRGTRTMASIAARGNTTVSLRG